jgi:methylated-DNA-protein-cysteine methyltransferase-like protein
MTKLDKIMALFKTSKKPLSKGHKRFIVIISLVPTGKVATYGQVAKLANFDGQARQVVWTLHSSSKKYRLPWHRIINSQGKIGIQDSFSFLKQKSLLTREGVKFSSLEKIDLKQFGWKPKSLKLNKIFSKL